ncbi:hypothetical protein CBOM_07501 [Ceraceosorus bombacis]|uniref:Uncharacterized protein n=1 Tax=Ceraceosorus bombacis TaxID=401625 RepID=A0A0P1BEM7_9BASI|nr:hypothetical protein CBOM_07501 [Ceraceosorus bombacis]
MSTPHVTHCTRSAPHHEFSPRLHHTHTLSLVSRDSHPLTLCSLLYHIIRLMNQPLFSTLFFKAPKFTRTRRSSGVRMICWRPLLHASTTICACSCEAQPYCKASCAALSTLFRSCAKLALLK